MPANGDIAKEIYSRNNLKKILRTLGKHLGKSFCLYEFPIQV